MPNVETASNYFRTRISSVQHQLIQHISSILYVDHLFLPLQYRFPGVPIIPCIVYFSHAYIVMFVDAFLTQGALP